MVAKLGYKIAGIDGPKAKPSEFSSKDDCLRAMNSICKLISRARSKEYGIEIVNMVSRGLFMILSFHLIYFCNQGNNPSTPCDESQVQETLT
jgi:hypothetical protein